jgi:hypothetical protein
VGDKIFLLTLRESLDLALQEVPPEITLPELSTPVLNTGGPVQPPVTGGVFPWAGIGSVGAKFDVLPTTLKDAISWFFDQGQWENAAKITSCEAPNHSAATDDTRGQPTAPGVTQEYSVGSWQINLLAHPGVSEEQARNDWWATQYARALYDLNGDWSSWAYCARANNLPQHVV